MELKILKKKYLGKVDQAKILMTISVICGVIPVFGIMNIVDDHM